MEVPHSPTFSINVIQCHDIQLRSGRIVNRANPIVVIEEEFEEENGENEQEEGDPNILDITHIEKIQHTPKPRTSGISPYPERLSIEKLVERPQVYFENELRNVCI